MGDTTISWTDETGGPVRGCSRTIAAGAKQSGCGDGTGGGCYAERMAWRIVVMDRARGVPEGEGKYDGLVRMTANGPRWTGVVRIDRTDLLKLGRRNPRAPRRMFPNSMSDIFHESLTNDQVAEVMAAFAIARNTTFQVLTKRAQRMHEWFAWVEREAVQRGESPMAFVLRAGHSRFVDEGCAPAWFDGKERRAIAEAAWPLPHLWLGVSVENQEAADERIPALLETPAARRFLSCEPLLGRLDIAEYMDPASAPCGETNEVVDWVIVGCESGPGARRCEVEWLRSLRDQCAATSTPFFLKQANGSTCTEWSTDADGNREPVLAIGPNSKLKQGGVIELPYLDGVQHAAFPEAP
jgi:protein gp37